MHTVTIHLDDVDWDRLEEIKGKRTWRELLMSVLESDDELKDIIYNKSER